MRLRPLPGVTRPGLAVALPTRPTPTVLIDAGAIADPKPEMFVQFAQLGVAYAEVAFGIAEPTVGLLTIGAEPGKGNKLAKRAHELLDAEPHGGLPISFAGNVEGGDLLAGKVDVVVTDGFTGNVALKTLEGTASYTAAQLREALGGSRAARFGALFQRRGLRELAERLDSETYGGAALLGLEATIVIAHGGRSHALKARIISKREFAGYWEYVLDEALFTSPPHPEWGGAALVGTNGELLGIGSLLVQQALDGEPVQGNMFVPVDLLAPILDDMLKFAGPARPPRPWLGMYTAELEQRLVVSGLARGGPAESAGVCLGDVVLEVAGERVSGLADMFRKVWRLGPAGVEVPLTVARDRELSRLQVHSADRSNFLKKPQLQ